MNDNDARLYAYPAEKLRRIENFIGTYFGLIQKIVCEKDSEYVQSDVVITKAYDGALQFVTVGMSGRAMTAPEGATDRVELCLSCSPEYAASEENNRVLLSQLNDLTKYPFRHDTWFGTGHTIGTNEAFRKTFSYDAFIFLEISGLAIKEEDEPVIRFLSLIPIFEEEAAWARSYDNGSLVLLSFLCRKYQMDNIFNADFKRESILPLLLEQVEIKESEE